MRHAKVYLRTRQMSNPTRARSLWSEFRTLFKSACGSCTGLKTGECDMKAVAIACRSYVDLLLKEEGFSKSEGKILAEWVQNSNLLHVCRQSAIGERYDLCRTRRRSNCRRWCICVNIAIWLTFRGERAMLSSSAWKVVVLCLAAGASEWKQKAANGKSVLIDETRLAIELKVRLHSVKAEWRQWKS